MIYQVCSSTVPIERWFATREEAIGAFERKCKRLGIRPSLNYPPSCCGDIYSPTIALPNLIVSGLQAYAMVTAL